MNKRTSNFVTVAILLVVMAVAWLASPAFVNGQEAKIEAVRKELEVLLKQAERLKSEGAVDKAELLTKQALGLKALLAKTNEKRPRKRPGGELGEILQGLKAGGDSLRTLGRAEEAENLERTAAEIQKKAAAGGKRDRGQSEREVALAQIKIMRIALQGLLDAGRKDLAESMEHAIHAQELALEGNRNKKAIAVRESAPSLGQRIELLMFAAQKLRDAGKKEQASVVANFSEQLRERFRAQQKRGREGEQREVKCEVKREGGDKEREVAAAQIEVMETTLVALREGQREDSADLLRRAIQARLVRLKQVKGEKAKIVLEREPKLAQTVEAFGLAAKLWREFGNQKNTGAVGRLARREGAKKQRPENKEGLQRLK